MFRWIALITAFLLSFIFSLWVYIYLHRSEYTQLALAYAFPSSNVIIGPIHACPRLDRLAIQWNNIEIRPVYLNEEQTIAFETLHVTIPYTSLAAWAFSPTTRPLHITDIFIKSAKQLPAQKHIAPTKSIPSALRMDIENMEIQLSENDVKGTLYFQNVTDATVRTIVEKALS